MNLSLVRDYAGTDATLGRLTVGSLILDTLELPWVSDPQCKGGAPDKSCIPAATYFLALHDTADHPHTFALVNSSLGVYHEAADILPGAIGRTEVLLHVGNYPRDSLGCILLGQGRQPDGEGWMITDSKAAFESFQAAVPWTPGHIVTISYAPGIAPA